MNEAIKALTLVCNEVKGKSRTLNFFAGEKNTKQVEVTESYSEVFPGVEMKAVFNGGHDFHLKAKAGSKIDIHKVMPERIIYVAYGDHREPVTGKIYREGDKYRVEANAMAGAEFNSDSELLIEIPK